MQSIHFGLAALGALILLLALGATAAFARGGFIEGGPHRLDETQSLGQLISQSGGRVHIVFVHGMRANGKGQSAGLRRALAERFGLDRAESRPSFYIELGGRPPRATVGTGHSATPGEWTPGDPEIWKTDAEWQKSRPFVDRYILHLKNGVAITVDEVNWWPLLFPLKCRYLLFPEHDLSGDDVDHLELCSRSDGHFHPWLTSAQVEQLRSSRPRSGGGAWANRYGKQQILNWGLSDAVIALGPMRGYLNYAMDKAFGYALDDAGDTRQVVISESLGSFAVLDALSEELQNVQSFVAASQQLYFFANQFALLELGRIQGLTPPRPAPGDREAESPDASEAGERARSPLDALAALAALARSRSPAMNGDAGFRPTQIVAINDPSDLLTWRVPAIPGVKVVNLYVRNARPVLGLFAHPIKAHTGHTANKEVWKILLWDKGRAARNTGRPPRPTD